MQKRREENAHTHVHNGDDDDDDDNNGTVENNIEMFGHEQFTLRIILEM